MTNTIWIVTALALLAIAGIWAARRSQRRRRPRPSDIYPLW